MTKNYEKEELMIMLITAQFLETWLCLTQDQYNFWARFSFLAKDTQFELKKYCWALTSRYSNDNTICSSTQYTGSLGTEYKN